MEATASLAPDWNAELVDGSEVGRARKLNFQDVRLTIFGKLTLWFD